ncbi:MAG: Sensor protein RstB [Pseudomonadota bacterium]|jgi:signal transduction histidine kinase
MPSLIGQKLYVRIWLAVVAAVVVLALVVGWLWQQAIKHERQQNAQRTGHEIVLRNSAGEVVGQAPARPVRVPGEGLEFQVRMNDGQLLYVQLPRRNRPPEAPLPPPGPVAWLFAPGFAWLLVLVALAVALGAYPMVRRLTKRLESLQQGVERWGSGDLSTRLPVQGQDEVAFLATRFNAAAERVQQLLQSHKALLANASHELRSPLARIRMGLELLGRDSASLPQRQEMARSIEELDQLIDEILLASRLDMRDARDTVVLGQTEEVDLVGLAAEECARTGAELDIAPDVSPLLIQGHAKLLRRLLRNLLENARRYGVPSPSDASVPEVRLTLARHAVPPDQTWAVMVVEDSGPGVPVDQRERIFEPFYRLPGASEREGGVGLGLSLVKTITERHGGHVHCEGRDEPGARFVVRLPL